MFTLVVSVAKSLLLDVVEHEGESLSFLAVSLDSDGGSSLDLLGSAVSVVLAVAEPLSEIISVFNFDKWYVACLCKSVNELFVLWVVAVFGQDAKNSLLAVQAFAYLIEAFHEP